ncbi:MAG: dehydrogenase E1 component subunit alpha/beta [Bacteroidota bacterium]
MPIAPSATFNRTDVKNQDLVSLYQALLKPRMIEEKMLILLRQGKISKWFSGIGQEAISVGVTSALEADEFIFTLHRNLGVFTTRQIPLARLFGQWQGKNLGFTKGRDRSFHFGTMEYHICGMISHLGPQLSLAGGAALASKLSQEQKIAVAFTGEGGTSQGEFHEALNVASVWQLPVIFVIENNGYGLSTPTSEQYRCEKLSDRGLGYGMRSMTIDGNNILEVYQTVRQLRQELLAHPEPILLECQTFRMRGHEEASGTKYVPKELFEFWEQHDPLTTFEHYLLEEKLLTKSKITRFRKAIKAEIEEGLAIAAAEPPVASSPAQELSDIYAPFVYQATPANFQETEKLRLVDAIANGLQLAMERHPKLVLMGQDIADYGGVFKITQGLMETFGADRVRNTPLCESAIVGAALGLSLKGYKAMVEMQFADFVTCGFNQIVNNLAKLHYRWGQQADVVIRMPTGAGVGAGPYHSQSNEAWFTHTPGLKVIYPSNPIDAKGLLLASFEDPNPILFFEHKALYRSLSAEVPTSYYTEEIGKAKVVQEGDAMTIITYGMGVQWAIATANQLGVSADIIDLRTLLPIDYETISASVQKTGKALVLHEATLFGGIGGEIAAYISEHLFEFLDGPVLRCASLDTPVPFAKELERLFLPNERLVEKMQRLAAY